MKFSEFAESENYDGIRRKFSELLNGGQYKNILLNLESLAGHHYQGSWAWELMRPLVGQLREKKKNNKFSRIFGTPLGQGPLEANKSSR